MGVWGIRAGDTTKPPSLSISGDGEHLITLDDAIVAMRNTAQVRADLGSQELDVNVFR